MAALAEHLEPPFQTDWIGREGHLPGTHSVLRVRHPALVGLEMAYSERNPFPDPAQTAHFITRLSWIREAADSEHQTGPPPETVHDLPAALRQKMADDILVWREEERQRRAAAKIICDRDGHRGIVQIMDGRWWCGVCDTHLDRE